MKTGLHINKELAIPIYVQLYEQIHLAIHDGQLPSGTRLPTVRALAVELGINANTVAKVYRELSNRGYLVLERGVGTFVAEKSPERTIDKTDVKKIRAKTRHLITLCHRVGLSLGEFTQLVENLWKETEKK